MKSLLNKLRPKKTLEKDSVPVPISVSQPNHLVPSNVQGFPATPIGRESSIIHPQPSPNSINIVITSGNSFQIGDTLNVNVADGGIAYFEPKSFLGLPSSSLRNNETLKEDLYDLEDSTDILTEKDIWMICELTLKDWKQLGRELGISEDEILQYEMENSEKPKLATFEMLLSFQKQHPATSLGFIAATLRKCQEYEALKKLKRTKR